MARLLVFLVIVLSSEPSTGADAASDAQDADDGTGAVTDAAGEASPDSAPAGGALAGDATTSDAPAEEASPKATDAAADGTGAGTCQADIVDDAGQVRDLGCPLGQYCSGQTRRCTFDCRIDADCGAHAFCGSVGRCVRAVDGCSGCCVGEKTGAASAFALFVAAVAMAISRRRK